MRALGLDITETCHENVSKGQVLHTLHPPGEAVQPNWGTVNSHPDSLCWNLSVKTSPTWLLPTLLVLGKEHGELQRCQI